MLTFEAIEVARVRAHLAGAEAEMVSRDVSHLSEAQRLSRALLLEELAAYREDGVFPKNPDFTEMTPYFIDADGVRCAMAHLLEVGGQAELVAKIARERNNAYVEELADEPGLLEWLDAAGITVAEAARIQPTYCPSSPASRFCGGTPAAVIEATVIRAGGFDSNTGRSVEAELRVNVVHGETSWKPGNTMGARITGKVGDTFVLRTSDGSTPMPMPFDDNGYTHVSLTGWENEPSIALSKDKAIEATTSSNCEEVLEKENPRWTQNPNACDDDGFAGGCSTTSAPASAAGALTLAIIAAIIAARARRLSPSRRA